MSDYRLNPYTREYEYIPDGEPYVFGDRIYIYGSHDRFDGNKFCMNDYVCYSADLNDLTEWRYEGVIYSRKADPRMMDGSRYLWAPDVCQGPDGRYYLYYCPDGDFAEIGVAVCDTPAGTYEYYDIVHDQEGVEIGRRPGDTIQFDPGVFRDDDGRIYLYSGNGPRIRKDIGKRPKASVVMELEEDMVTVKGEPRKVLPVLGEADGDRDPETYGGADLTSFAGHEMFEASSIRKIRGKYYLVYSSVAMHQLCYAVSDRPDGGYRYGGVLVSNADVFEEDTEIHAANPNLLNAWGNDHGGIECINGEYYIFYHRQTQRSNFSRQGCAQKITLTEDGRFLQAELTSQAFGEGPLPGEGIYPASCVCHLHKNFKQAVSHQLAMGMKFPFLTQSGRDYDVEIWKQAEARGEGVKKPPRQYITNFKDKSYALFRYFDLTKTKKVIVRLRGKATGTLYIRNGERGETLGQVEITPNTDWWLAKAEITAPLMQPEKGSEICLYFEGKGAIDILEFALK